MRVFYRETGEYEDVPEPGDPEPAGDIAEYVVQTLVYSLSLRRYVEPGTRMTLRDREAQPLLAVGAIAPIPVEDDATPDDDAALETEEDD